MPVLIKERDGDVLILRLNRPERMNALSSDLVTALKWALVEDAAASEVRAVVITGEGKGFCPGADLKEEHLRGEQPGGLQFGYNPLAQTLGMLPKPVIAAVNGATAGAGLGLACAADVRIAARSAKFVPAFARIGVVPDNGASYFVTRILGYSKAFDFLCSGLPVSAEEALAIGLVNDVVDDDQLMERALHKAHIMAAMPGRAVELTKALLDAAQRESLASMLWRESTTQAVAIADPARAAARADVVSAISHDKKAD